MLPMCHTHGNKRKWALSNSRQQHSKPASPKQLWSMLPWPSDWDVRMQMRANAHLPQWTDMSYPSPCFLPSNCRSSCFWQPPPPHSPTLSVSSVKSVRWPPVLRPLTFKLYSPHQTDSRDRVKKWAHTRTKKKKNPDTLSDAFMILLL